MSAPPSRRPREQRTWRHRAPHCAALVALAFFASACLSSIGHSVDGREIVVRTFGDGPRDVVIVGGLHTGSEDNTRVIVEQLATYIATYPSIVPDSVTLHVIASANPDGTARGVHTNANGVDLNRNWPADDWTTDACHPSSGCRQGLGGPAPLSEPETAALYNFIQATRPEITIVWHAEAPLIEANEVPGADVYGSLFAAAAGYPYVEEWTAYDISGELIDALEQRLALRAFDVELSRCCTVTEDDFIRSLNGLIAVLNEVERAANGPIPTRTPDPSTPQVTATPTFSLRLGRD